MARLVLICGLPGAGKTTLGRELEQSLHAVLLSPDEWMDALRVDLWDEPFRDRLEERFRELAMQLLRLGSNVVLEFGFWQRRERDEVRLAAREVGAAVELRYLDVPIEELAARVDRRRREDPPITSEHLTAWLDVFEAPDAAEVALFDPP